MTPLRFGLLGTGYWALHAHGAALRDSPRRRWRVSGGGTRTRRPSSPSQLGTRSYEDLDELLHRGRRRSDGGPSRRPGRRSLCGRPRPVATCCWRSRSPSTSPAPPPSSRRLTRPGWRRSSFSPNASCRATRLGRRGGRGRALAQRPPRPLRQHIRAGEPLRQLAVAQGARRAVGHRAPRPGGGHPAHGQGDLGRGAARADGERHGAPRPPARRNPRRHAPNQPGLFWCRPWEPRASGRGRQGPASASTVSLSLTMPAGRNR